MKKLTEFKYTTIVTADDYFVSHHQISDIKVLPGTALLELVIDSFDAEGIEIKNIRIENCTFHEPVIANETYCRKVVITCKLLDDGSAAVNVRSCKVIDEQEIDDYTDNFSCIVRGHIEENVKTINIDELKNKAVNIWDMEDFYANTRQMNIFHYEYMKGYGKIYDNKDVLFADIGLCPVAEQDIDMYYIQPVYLDAATIVALSLFHNQLFQNTPVPCIPIHIDSFKVYKMLRGRCYVYVRKSTTRITKSNEIFYTDIEIYDESGEIVAFINNIAVKKVREIKILKNIEYGLKSKDNENDKEKAKETYTQPKIVKNYTIEDYIISLICERKNVKAEDISTVSGFYEMGLESSDLMDMVGSLENYLGVTLYPTLLFEYSNVKELASYLCDNYGKECNKVSTKNVIVNKIEEKTVNEREKSFAFLKRKLVGADLTKNTLVCSGILYFGTSSDDAEMIEQVLHGKPLKKIIAQNSYEVISENEINIDCENENDYFNIVEKYTALQKEISILFNGNNLGSSVERLIYLVKALINMKKLTRIKIIYYYYYYCQSEDTIFNRAIEAALKTISLENGKFSYKLIEFDNMTLNYSQKIIDELNSQSNLNGVIRYIRNTRNVQKIVLLDNSANLQDNVILKNNGVYLFTGGAGKIGSVIAEYFASKVKCRIIITGRSDINNPNIKRILSKIESFGCSADYFKKDISVYEDVKEVTDTVRATYGKIDGIIHCAGIIDDAIIINKNVAQMRNVMGVKIAGIKNLDLCTKNDKLEFVAVCSSSASITGNIGQVDYAYANAFMDFYVEYRNELVKKNERSGKSVAVNWTYWQDGGMQINDQTLNNLNGKLGISALSNEDGINAFLSSLNMYNGHIMPIKGDSDIIFNFLDGSKESELGSNEVQMENALIDRYDEDISDQDVAIIGLEGKYPKANNLKEFWKNLCSGRDCISEIPESRFDYKKYYSDDKNSLGTIYCKWGGFLENIDKFSPMFFNISPREAEIMDPQERLFLLLTWHLLENAGYDCEKLSNHEIGVYVGSMWGQYQLLKHQDNGKNYALSSIYSSIANRVSYTFNFCGPSMAIDTMCSSSLTSIHLACQAINSGECEMAIAGGVNLNLHPNKFLFLSQQKFASQTGKCHSFDENADGYVPGEGIGAVLLKPLKKAIEDRDNIYGIIKGSVITHGGKSGGYTVPNPKSETNTVVKALEKAKINARNISYIEAHGTGTALGDPIEITSLSKAFEKYTDDKQFCAIGSVKSNIGHCEAAAGIASITKVLLQFKHRMLVPSINVEHVNEKIEFEKTPFKLQRSLEEWNVGSNDILAGVSAFGAGGSNAHIVLKAFEREHKVSYNKRDSYVILISANSKNELAEYLRSYVDFIDEKCSWLEKISSFSSGIENWVKKQVATVTGIPIDNIILNGSLSEYGVDKYSLQVLKNIFNGKIMQNSEEASIRISEESLISSLVKKIERSVYGRASEDIDYEGYEHELLEQIAYITQNGRKHFKERVAICVSSLKELYNKLNLCLDENYDGTKNGIYRGSLSRKAESVSDDTIDIGAVLKRYDSDLLAKAFVEGREVNWSLLYDELPWKIELPTYPFATKRYWCRNIEDVSDTAITEVKKNVVVDKQDDDFEEMLLKKASAYNGDEVKLEIIDDKIAIVRMEDRENRNMFSENVVHGLINKFNIINSMKDIKAVIITGYDKVFCMGGTEQQLNDIANSKHQFSDVKFLHRGLLETKVPVIAAMQGHAYGGGFLFGLYSDIVILAEESVYAAVFTKYGFTPGMGATFILEKKLGRDAALEMMYTARPFSGKELKERNAQVCVREFDDVMNYAFSVARLIADKPRITLETLKQEIAGRTLEQLPHILERENLMHSKTFTTDETKKRLAEKFRLPDENKKDEKKTKNKKTEEKAINKKQISEKDSENLELLELVQKGVITISQAKKLMKF